MSDFTRRNFLKTASLASAAVATAGLGLYSGKSEAAEFKLKFANNLPITHSMNVRAREMAKAVREETNGAVQIQVFPSSQLGSDTDTLAQVRSGAVDMFALSPVILGTLVPSVQISAVGFAFKDYDQVWSAMDGELGAHVRSEIAKTDTLFAFDKIWDNGFRVTTTSTRPIVTPDDLKAMKLRVQPSQIIMSILHNERAVIPLSAHLEGEYGESGISIGVPCILSDQGVEQVLEIDLTYDERRAMRKSCDIVRESLDKVFPEG